MYTGTGVVLDLLQVKYLGHEYGLRLNVDAPYNGFRIIP